MQKLLLLLITTIIGLIMSLATLKGRTIDNITETKTVLLSHFENIDSDMIFNVEVVKSNEEKAVITSNYMQFVNISVKNNTLHIGYKRNQSMENVNTRIVIFAKDVKSVSASTASVVKIKNVFNIQKFSTESGGKIFGDSNAKNVSISTQSGGSVFGKLNTDHLVINAESGSSINIQGKIGTATISSEEASKITATKTDISVATVKAESASSVTLSVSKQLIASASSLATIRYKTLSGIKFSATRDSGGTIDML
ncbi:GIN domain-containing protein [Chryseobacterium lineare]